MEDWVQRALAKWPNVPHLYGWIHLDRRGQWFLQGERVDRPKLIDMMRFNYAADDRGCWFFQNGPQRGYVTLAYTPLVFRVQPGGDLIAHTDQTPMQIRQCCLDSDGSVVLDTDLGAGGLDGEDLPWVLEHLDVQGRGSVESAVDAALGLPSGSQTTLRLDWRDRSIAVMRLDANAMPTSLGFEREPQPPEAGA